MTMQQNNAFYTGGKWVAPQAGGTCFEIVDPSTEAVIGLLPMGHVRDVDLAVRAAREAFPAWSASTPKDRQALLARIAACYEARLDDLAAALSREMGAPLWFARQYQAQVGLAQIQSTLRALQDFTFTVVRGSTQVVREPVGVAALITPWNWPLNQICAKLAAAIAAGCAMVLKPSELAPSVARIFAEIMDEAGTPAGVFNMLFGDGPTVGRELARHPDVDMVSITGSTRAGVDVAIQAAPTVKRVAQELGGKSASLVLDDADLQLAVTATVAACMMNSGQSCAAPTRLLVPRHQYELAVAIAATTAGSLAVGDPQAPGSKLGPLANRTQFARVQQMIEAGIREGARVAAGGLGRPEGLEHGFYARPTIFSEVTPQMQIAREEIFGPVLVVLPYDTEADGIALANDSQYGLAGFVWSADAERARRVAGRLRVGMVQINGARGDYSAPFGGYKASGNGRECGEYGIAEFLEYKAIAGCMVEGA